MRVVSDTLLGVVLGMVCGVVDVCRGLLCLVVASTEDVDDTVCPSPLGKGLQSIALEVRMCPGTMLGSCIAVGVLFVDELTIGVRATRLGVTWGVGLFWSGLLSNWLFTVGMSGTRLGVV